MIEVKKLPKACTEVLEILKHISEEEYKKIPNELIKMFETKQDKQHKIDITHFEDFEKQEILDETKAILAIIFRDYWATEEQRRRIIANEKYQINIQEEQKRIKYNPDEVFKSKKI